MWWEKGGFWAHVRLLNWCECQHEISHDAQRTHQAPQQRLQFCKIERFSIAFDALKRFYGDVPTTTTNLKWCCWWRWLHNDDCDTIERHLCFDIFLYAIALYQIAFIPSNNKNNDTYALCSSELHLCSQCDSYGKINFKSMKRVICTNPVSFPLTILHPATDSHSTATSSIDFKLATALGVGC